MIPSLFGAVSNNFSPLGFTATEGLNNPVSGVATVELTQPSGDKNITKYDDTIADDAKVNYPEVGTTVVRTLRSKSLEEKVRCFVGDDALGSDGSAPFGSSCLGGSCGCALTLAKLSRRRPGGRKRAYMRDLPPIPEVSGRISAAEASHVDADECEVEIAGSEFSAEPEIAPNDFSEEQPHLVEQVEGPLLERIFKIAVGVNACSKRLEDSKNRIEDDAIEANSEDPVNEILAPNGYRCIDVEIESEYPGDLEKALVGSKFLGDPETQKEFNAGSGDIDDWELVPDLCGDVPARLPQSDSAWRDYD